MSEKMTAKQMILDRLSKSPTSLAIHEFHLLGYSENNIATRLNELEREGKLESQFRKGEHFKEWSIKRQEPQFDSSGQALMFGRAA